MPPRCDPFSPSQLRRSRRSPSAACGTEGIQLADDDPDYDGAVLFSQRCSGCHTLKPAGAQGSANRSVRDQGPNLDQRVESPRGRPLRDPQRRLLGRDHAAEHRHRRRGGRRRRASSPSTPAPTSTARRSPATRRRDPVRRTAARRRASRPRPAVLDLRASARTRARPGGAGAPRRGRGRSTSCSSSTPAAASCCPRSRACAPSRTRPRTRSPSAKRAGGDAARRDRADAGGLGRGQGARRPSSPRSRRAATRSPRRCRTCPHPDGARRRGDDDAVTLREVGERPSFDFEVRDHLDLGLEHGWIEIEKAAAASGSRFAYLLGDLVMVELALIRFAVETRPRRGLRAGGPAGAGPRGAALRHRLLPRRARDDLRGRARRALPGRHLGGLARRPARRRDPRRRRRCRAATPGSRPASGARPAPPARTPAGSSASTSSTRSRCSRSSSPRRVERPSTSGSWRSRSASSAALEIPYRVVDIAVGDLGAPAARKFDCEAWIPSQERYRELTSCSNTTDYQARRLGARYRPAGRGARRGRPHAERHRGRGRPHPDRADRERPARGRRGRAAAGAGRRRRARGDRRLALVSGSKSSEQLLMQ